MAILHRNLLSELENFPIELNVTACFIPPGCDPLVDHCYLCPTDYFTPPPPPPPPVRHHSAHTHVVPYLLSGACALGVALLILTACTILLRHRWTRWRSSRRLGDSTSELVFVDEDQHHPGPIDHPIWYIATVGLPQSVIDEITAFKYRKSDKLIEGTDCSVCLAEFEDGDDLRLLPKCSHAFHLNCIDTWLRSHKNCPLCRSPIVVDSASPVNLGGVVSPNSAGQVSSRLSSEGISSANQGGSVSASININQVGQGESSGQRERADDFGRLPIDGVRIEEILKRNRQNRGMSDLGDNYRTLMTSNDGPLPLVRRSVSLDAEAATAISNSIMISISSLTGEGSSRQGKKMHLEKNRSTRWHGNSGTSSSLRKSSSIGCSLQKAPVSMKRSISSSGKIFSSFRGSKSQSSILPL